MIVSEVFENTIYPKLKEYVEKTSIYKPKVTKKKPQESKTIPIVPVSLIYDRNTYNNLSYGEETYTFGINIDVYTCDVDDVSKRTICNEITNVIVDYLKENYRLTIKITLDAPNTDSNIHRNNLRITGKLDTKYGLDKLVIYPV